jgi:hypothetical protein
MKTAPSLEKAFRNLFGIQSGPVLLSTLKNQNGLLNLNEVSELAGIKAYVHIATLSVQ